MADNILKKLFDMAVSNSNKENKTETQEEVMRRVLTEMMESKAQQNQAGAQSASSTSSDPLQNLLKIMNFQVDQANSEKSELAVEKAKRLEAEREAEELRKRLVEMKLVGADQNKVDRMEKQLHNLEAENLKSSGMDLEKMFQLLMQTTKEAGSQNGESNRGKPEKQYSDPAWFPRSSGPNDHDSLLSKDNVNVDEHSPSAPPPYNSLFHSQSHNFSGRGGPLPRYDGPSPPDPSSNLPQLMNMPPPQFNNMNNFQRPQFPSNGNYYNAPPPSYFSPEFHGQMPMRHGFHMQERPPFNPNENFNMPHFTQGPDQVRFSQPPQQNQMKNKTKQPPPTKQNQPTKQKGDNQKNQPKQPNQQNPSNQPSQANQSTEKKKRNKKKTSQPNNQGTETNNLNPPNVNDTLNLTQEEIKKMKKAVDNYNCNEAKSKKNAKNAFKKQKKQKSNQQNSGENPDDDDDDSSDSDENANINADAPKPPPRKTVIPEKQDSEKAGAPQTTGSAKKKDSSGPKDQPKKSAPQQEESQNNSGAKKKDTSGPKDQPKKSAPQQEESQNNSGAKKKDTSGKKSGAPKQQKKNDSQTKTAPSNSSDLNLFVGENYPTLKDIESGRLKLGQEVKDILMIAKVGDETITEQPKMVQDMIMFQGRYPNARLIVIK